MPRGRRTGSSNNPKFNDIPTEWRSGADAASTEKLNSLLVEVTKSEELNQHDKKESQPLQDAKEAYQEAGFGFKEGTRLNRLKIKYVLKKLIERGQL